MSSRNYLTEERYLEIKHQINDSGGLTVREISEILGISTATIQRIKNTADWNHYLVKYRPATWAKEIKQSEDSVTKYGAVMKPAGGLDSVARYDRAVAEQRAKIGLNGKTKTKLKDRLTREMFAAIKSSKEALRIISARYSVALWQIARIKRATTYEEALKSISSYGPTKEPAQETPEQVKRPQGAKKKITPEIYDQIKQDYDYNKDLSVEDIAEKYDVSRGIISTIGTSKDYNDFREIRKTYRTTKQNRVTTTELDNILKSLPENNYTQIELKSPIVETPTTKVNRDAKFKKGMEVRVEVKVTLRDIKRAKGGLLAKLKQELLG